MNKHKRLDRSGFEGFSYVFLGFMSIIFVFPLVSAIMVSITSEESLVYNGYQLIPDSFSFEAYKVLFTSYGKSLLRAAVISISSGIVQPILTIFLSMLMAYPLSQPDFKTRDFWRKFLLITMLFSGGLIPQYILITKYLHLKNNVFVYYMPWLGAWNIFLFRTFFVNIDKSMIESAKIDGANKMQILLRIMLPLTKPLVAMNFFQGFLYRWNDISTPLYYITDTKLYPVQYLLQRMIESTSEAKKLVQLGMASASAVVDIPIESLRFAMAVIGALPVIVLFPFLQRYYAKGITLGSTKG